MTVRKKKAKPIDAPRVIGVILALIGGLVAIGIAIYISHDADYLWAIVLLALIAERVKDTESEYEWKPAVLGAVMSLLCLALGAVIYYTNGPLYLWAMVLIGLLTDSII